MTSVTDIFQNGKGGTFMGDRNSSDMLLQYFADHFNGHAKDSDVRLALMNDEFSGESF